MSPEETGNHSISDCKPYTGKRYYGKYTGTIIGNQDPLLKGRILALVPSVTVFVPSTWIEPCSAFAGFGVGFFAVPPIDASVWVEFIEGDPNYPVWTGGYWDEKDLLAIPPSSRPMIRSDQVMLRILSGTTITMDNALGVTIETSIGTKVIVNSSGISI
jgi:hypothetical protein